MLRVATVHRSWQDIPSQIRRITYSSAGVGDCRFGLTVPEPEIRETLP